MIENFLPCLPLEHKIKISHPFISLLFIEDNREDYLLVNKYLEESFKNATVFHADTLQKGIDIIEKEKIDVILLDLTLPDETGLQAFKLADAKAPGIPIIILTDLADTELALETLKTGAQDYLVKGDLTAAVLAKSILFGIERNKIRVRLRKSEEQYKYLFFNNPLPMFAYDRSHKFLMVNDAALHHYGYSDNEFSQLTIEQLKPAETNKKETFFANSINSDKCQDYNTDLQHQKKNGEIIDVEMKSHDIVIEGQNACLTIIHDVTERNKAQEQLRESKEIFRTIAENFPNGSVTILDKNLTILYTNGREFHIEGADAAYFKNTKYTSHFHSPVKENIQEKLIKVFENKSIVFEASHNDLSYMISAVPLSEAGNINKILIATQNITEQKRNETQKELLIGKLTQKNNDLQQFSYITSHNLRSPLSNLLSLIKMIDISAVPGDTNQLLLKSFEECTTQLNDTVNDLINILLIKNTAETKKEKIDIRKTFDKVVHSVRTIAEQKKMTVVSDFNNAYEVDFNRSYLESILLNLITNAIKYSSPKRTPEIKISTRTAADGVKLYFSDNGLGIDLKRYKDRIFGLYQRFHGNEDSKGLGLYMVNSQINIMGGSIDVESEVDEGTTFIITFKTDNDD